MNNALRFLIVFGFLEGCHHGSSSVESANDEQRGARESNSGVLSEDEQRCLTCKAMRNIRECGRFTDTLVNVEADMTFARSGELTNLNVINVGSENARWPLIRACLTEALQSASLPALDQDSFEYTWVHLLYPQEAESHMPVASSPVTGADREPRGVPTQEEVQCALCSLRHKAMGCRQFVDDGQLATVRYHLVFESSGELQQNVLIEVSTPEIQQCIAEALQPIRVQPFTQDSYSVTYPLLLDGQSQLAF